jgi:hypothetical protein
LLSSFARLHFLDAGEQVLDLIDFENLLLVNATLRKVPIGGDPLSG